MTKAHLLVSAASLALCPSVLLAQSAPPAPAAPSTNSGSALQEIVVTAQRKTERLQDVPISVNVVAGAALTARGAGDTVDLPSLVPGLQISGSGGAGTPFLRGVGTTAGDVNNEPSVATYVDGVYIANSYTDVTQLNNVERIEVLKGPQGTLFGRNATGGVIQVITRDPTDTPMMEVNAGYGNYKTVSGSLYATGKITDTLAANLAVQGSDQGDGWGRNVVFNRDAYKSKQVSVRAKLLWRPTPDLTVKLTGDYASSDSNQADYRLPPGVAGLDGVPFPRNPYDTRSNIAIDNHGEPGVFIQQYGFSLRAEYDTGVGKIVDITAYRRSFGLAYFDPDMTPVPFEDTRFPPRQHNISQELQYISPASWPVSVTAGLYYFNNSAGYANALISGLALDPAMSTIVTVPFTSIQHTKSVSGYLQADYKILPRTKITGGIRFTHERNRANENFAGSDLTPLIPHNGYDKPTWRVALDHAFTNDIHAYASYNRGVKGGGFDLENFGAAGYKPETLDAYEGGIKTELFDHRVRFNIAYFYYKYRNIQVQIIPAGASTVALAQTTNAAKARIQGLDMDFAVVPVPHFTINGGFAYTDGKYLDFQNTVSYPISPLSPRASFCTPPNPQPAGTPCVIDASGNQTVRTPKYTGNVGATYDIETEAGKFSATVSASYNGDYFFSADNRYKQKAYTLLNASAGWTTADGRYGISVWGKNLTNRYYLSANVPSSLGDLTTPAAPRTYGFTLHSKFGG